MLELDVVFTLTHADRELICVALTHQAVQLEGFAAKATSEQAVAYLKNAMAMRDLVARIDAAVTERFRAALK